MVDIGEVEVGERLRDASHDCADDPFVEGGTGLGEHDEPSTPVGRVGDPLDVTVGLEPAQRRGESTAGLDHEGGDVGRAGRVLRSMDEQRHHPEFGRCGAVVGTDVGDGRFVEPGESPEEQGHRREVDHAPRVSL